ncbi:hypothetical protein J3R82DRAFT_4495 [Butyriboletus roseoflavus]|nr:hypothetical protein J3R82DRAFT_4495 [Butyriboletus roseoflavus]
MLGRAKWDAWAKHRDLDQYEAKWLYVDALLKALSKYSDKTAARDLMDELRSYGGDSGNLVSSYTLTRTGSRGSSSSTSTASEDNPAIPPSHGLHDFQHPSTQRHQSAVVDESSDDGEAGDESRDLPAVRDLSQQQQRPLSSVSFSSRYKTPITGSLALSPPPLRRTSVPPTQPLPDFEMPSAFADPHIASSPSHIASLSARDLAPYIQSTEHPYKSLPITSRRNTTIGTHLTPPSRAVSVSLEHAMENMQAHLAALTERIDTLESSLTTYSNPQAQSSIFPPSRASSGRGSPADSGSVSQVFEWDIDDMGLWTLVLKPLLQNLSFLQRLFVFFLKGGQNRSPVLIVVRRLCLDISFVMVVVGVLRTAWTKTVTRRREVGAALILLWGAVTGKRRILGGRN